MELVQDPAYPPPYGTAGAEPHDGTSSGQNQGSLRLQAGGSDPLVIDLDGTLLRTDALLECALAFLRRNPLGLLQMLLWVLRGRAVLKHELARRTSLDLAAWPLNAELEAFARHEKAGGRAVFLATAADQAVARSMADRLGFFDGVFASNGRVNLKGAVKLGVLAQRFPAGFAYAGDSRADFPIWAKATETIIVGGRSWTRRTAQHFANTTRIFHTPSRARALLECARPHQWAKNALVFVPAVLGGVLMDTGAMLTAAISFAALCIAASATYVMNDLIDVHDDRQHWTKCKRPIASGRLPVSTAVIAIPLGLAAGVLLAYLASPQACLALICYLLLTIAYSMGLKRVVILDVAVLASLFTLRLLIGIAGTGVFASPWLLVFSMFLFASLCFAKRYTEVERAIQRGQKALAGRGYVPRDSPLLFALGLGTGIASIIIMVLYVMFDAYRQTFYGNTLWLWAFPVILFLWFARVWLVAARGELHDDPVAFAVNDAPSILLGGAILTAFLLAWSGMFA